MTEYPVISGNSTPTSIAPGPEGNEWFTEKSGNRIGRITPAGVVTEYPIPDAWERTHGHRAWPGRESLVHRVQGRQDRSHHARRRDHGVPAAPPERGPLSITAGSDGSMWFTEYGIGAKQGQGGAVGRITTSRRDRRISDANGRKAVPFAITSGPDGNLWFTEQSKGNVGRLVPSSFSFTEFHVSGGAPHGIAPGPDGEVWFTEEGSCKIGRITLSGTTVTLVSLEPNSHPNDIAPGPDGALWFTEDAQQKVMIEGEERTIEVSRIGRITPSGELELFPTHVLESRPRRDRARRRRQHVLHGGRSQQHRSDRAPVSRARCSRRPPSPATTRPARLRPAAPPGRRWASLQPSTSALRFDGYQWLLNGTPVAKESTYTPTQANIGYPLACTLTVSYPLLNVTTGAASAAVTMIPPPPTLASVQQSKTKWREGKNLARISTKGKRGPQGPRTQAPQAKAARGHDVHLHAQRGGGGTLHLHAQRGRP